MGAIQEVLVNDLCTPLFLFSSFSFVLSFTVCPLNLSLSVPFLFFVLDELSEENMESASKQPLLPPFWFCFSLFFYSVADLPFIRDLFQAVFCILKNEIN